MKIVRVEPLILHIPFYADHVAAAMHRAQTHDERVLVYRVELDDGTVGYGDTQGGGTPDASRIETLIGANPLAHLFDDSLGFALQIALLDAVGRSTDTPAHALLGHQVRDRCPLSWWDIDMPPGDWTKEAEARLQNVPLFAQGMARQAVEEYALRHGHQEVTAEVMAEARSKMGM